MKLFYCSFVALVSLLLIWLNLQLYQPTLTAAQKQEDIVKQLNFLEKELKEDRLGIRMQSIFPEGYVFINALYGLTWAELAQQTDDSELKLNGILETKFAYKAIDSDFGKAPFQKSMSLAYGVYYQGWRNYLLAKMLSISENFNERSIYATTFQKQCEEIAKAFRNSETPYLSSYSDMSWPADSFLALASLAIHDKLFKPAYQQDIQTWLAKVKYHRDPQTSMLAHKTDADSGNLTESPRGGSMALMLRLLAEIDQPFAKEQYALFKENFVSNALGLPKVREYPKGTFGIGDVDSGPVILGTSFAGTIVSIGTFQTFGETSLADRQYKTVSAFGLQRSDGVEKSYLFGILPMADAFIAWSRTAPELITNTKEGASGYWRLKFQVISFLIPLVLIALYYRKPLIAKVKTKWNSKRD